MFQNFNFNDLALSLSQSICSQVTPYRDWLSNKKKKSIEDIYSVRNMSQAELDSKKIVVGRYLTSARNVLYLVQDTPDVDISVDVNANAVFPDTMIVYDLYDSAKQLEIRTEDLMDEFETNMQSLDILDNFMDTIASGQADTAAQLAVFNQTVSKSGSTLTAGAQQFANQLNKLMIETTSTPVEKVKRAIGYIIPKQVGSSNPTSVASDASDYTGAAPSVFWGNIIFSTIGTVIPTIIGVAATALTGIFGLAWQGLYTAGTYVYNTLSNGGKNIGQLHLNRRYSDFGIGSDVCWYSFPNDNSHANDLLTALKNITGYTTGSIYCIPLFGASIWIRSVNDVNVQIGIRWSLFSLASLKCFRQFIYQWYQRRTFELMGHDRQYWDNWASDYFKNMQWFTGDSEADIMSDTDINDFRSDELFTIFDLLIVHLCWYREKYLEYSTGNDYNMFTILGGDNNNGYITYNGMSSSDNITADSFYPSQYAYGINNTHKAHNGNFSVLGSNNNRCLYELSTNRWYMLNGINFAVSFSSSETRLDAFLDLLKDFIYNADAVQDQFFVPRYWLAETPYGAYNVRTDASIALQYGIIATATVTAIVASTIVVGLAVAKGLIRKAAFQARRKADIESFKENGPQTYIDQSGHERPVLDDNDNPVINNYNKSAWKMNKKANFLERLLSSSSDAIESVSSQGQSSVTALLNGQNLQAAAYVANELGFESVGTGLSHTANLLGVSDDETVAGCIDDIAKLIKP